MSRLTLTVVIGIVIAVLAVGCRSSVPPASEVGSWTGSASATAPPSVAPSASPEPLDAPPAATLAAEGGDPVVGQLGSYTWGDGGSDSPWLPGAPITVGLGEPLSVALAGDAAVATWRVQARSSTDDGAVFAVADGDGDIAFSAPDVGTWSVAVTVSFRASSNTATYYWEVQVR